MSRRTLASALLVVFISLCSASGAMAQEAWERIAVLGVNTRAVGFGGAYTFAGTSRGVWRSGDQGVTWEQSVDSPLLAQSVVVDLVASPSFSTDGTVFVITDEGRVWRSTDAGNTNGFTFQQIKGLGQDKTPGTSLAIHPRYNNPSGFYQHLFVGYRGDGLSYTTSAGASSPTWSTGGGPIAKIYDLAISPDYTSTGLLLVGGQSNDGPLWMRNSTGNWSNKSTGVGSGPTETVTALLWPKDTATSHQLAFAGTIDHGMYKATNMTWSGGAWSAACDGTCNGTGCSGTVPRVNAMARAAASAAKFIEGRADGAFLSTNDGGACSAMDFSATIQEVEFQPEYDGTSACYVFFGTPHGLFRKVLGTCAPAPVKRGPEIVDGYAVALAGDGAGQFMGSLSEGLFKCVDPVADERHNMVRYNNFPNGLIPQVVAIALNPSYNETFAECEDGRSELFVGANFPASPSDNGVYRSVDFGNTWTRLSTAWPTSANPIMVFDLAISPNFSGDAKLYVGTSVGLYRWDGGSIGWQKNYPDPTLTLTAPVYAIGLPPNFSYSGGTGKVSTIWIGTDDGTVNQVFSNLTGGDGTWANRAYSGTGTNPPPRGRVTGFAFPQAYNPGGSGTANNVFVSATTAPSIQAGTAGGVFRGYVSGSFWLWEYKGPASGADRCWDIAAEPAFLSSSSYQDLLVATDSGIHKSTDAGAAWVLRKDTAAYAVTYDRNDTTGSRCMAGYQGNQLNGVWNSGSGLSANGGRNWDAAKAHTGYHYLPDDVWASVAHERNSNILFSSSPSMGVFVSEDKGISFRPWNKGMGGGAGPCALRSGLGINMLAGRRNNANLDIVWAGTTEQGLKARYIYYNSTAGKVDLETENGVDLSGWRHNTWTGSGDTISGRWERIEVTPNTAMAYPVWATGQAWGSNSAQGMAVLPAGPWWSVWRTQNSGLPVSLDTRGVRQGYQSLNSGAPASGESVGYHLWNFYQVQVPAGSTSLQVVMDDLDDGGPMDPDLYLRHGALPTLDIWDYRPWTNGDEPVCVNPSPAVLLSENFTSLLSESFTSGIPGSWTVVDGGSGGGAAATWTTGNPGSRSIGSPFAAPFAIVDSDFAGGTATQDESLITPSLNCSTLDQVVLLFDNYFYRYQNEKCDVDVSIDGGSSWTNIYRMTGASNFNPVSVDISAQAAGRPNVKVRFRYYDASYEWWWAVDNVRIYGIPKTWSIRHSGAASGPASTWTVGNPCSQATLGAPMSPPYALVDNTCSGGGLQYQEYLEGPSFNASSYSKVTLSFTYQFQDAGTDCWFYIYRSTDGGATWQFMTSRTGNTAPTDTSIDISSWAAGQNNCRVRFLYYELASSPGGWLAIDNIQVTGEGPKPGTWYIGIYGYANTTNTYNLTATLNAACTPLKVDPDPKPRSESVGDGGESAPWPEAPSSNSSWGTVSGSGVYQGTGSASAIEIPEAVVWVQRNGTTSPLTNLYANTVVQLSDLTLVAGCTGDVFFSPAPDQGATTWVNTTANVANAGSNDFRDLLVASNGDVLIAANGTGTGTSAGGVWLSGDKGAHWMRLSQGFDSDSQQLTDLMADSGSPPSYYASTGATGEYTRTITANPYPTVASVNPATGPSTGGTIVTLTGTGFLGTCPTGNAGDCPSPNDRPVVLFGDTEVVPSSWTATSIICTTPAGAMGATKVTVRNPDTRRSSTGPNFTYSCSAPDAPVVTTCADYSAYDFNGIRVIWSGPSSWGDAGETSRSQSFYRDGAINTTLVWDVTARTDNPTIKKVPRSYRIRATNSCGLTADSSTSTATDDAEAGAYTNSTRDMKWHTGGKTQLDWGNMLGETSYTVYRGSGSSISNLASGGGVSVCTAYTGATANTGAILVAEPSAGQFYWYLVTASAGTAEGTLGTGTGGSSRAVTSSGVCGSP